jgi:hypothetical protein
MYRKIISIIAILGGFAGALAGGLIGHMGSKGCTQAAEFAWN